MAVNNSITRSNAEVLIDEETSKQIIQELPTKSVFLRLANRMPDMTRKQLKIPVMAGNVEASFVTGDTGLKQTATMSWDKVFITAEELAVIIPIPEAVLDDAEYDIWGEVRPRIVEAFGKAIDAAAFHSVNKPDSWPVGLVPGAVSAGNYVNAGTSGLYQAINGENGVIAKVEEQNIPVTSYVGALALRAKLRGAVDTNGQPIFRSAYSNGNAGSFVYELNGTAIEFPNNGSFSADEALLLAGNFSYCRYAIRQDITYKILDQAAITDADGKVILNLAQQDCVALRAVMRLGWAMPKPVNPVSGRSYFPFAVLKPSNITTIDAAQYKVTAPVKSATPQATHDAGTGYTAAIEWSPAAATFAASTAYTATVTLTAAENYVFPSNFGKGDIVGLPASSAASKVTVTRVSDTEVKIVVKYVATEA